MTKYEPARDASGQVVGIYFVGFELGKIVDDLRQAIVRSSGTTGYGFVMYATGPRKGTLMFHPSLEGKNLLSDVTDADGGHPFEELLKSKSGLLNYPWLGAKGERVSNLTAFEYTDTWGGLVVAKGTSLEEVTRESRLLRNTILLSSALAALLLGGLLWLFMTRRLQPVSNVVDMLRRIGEGDLSVRAGRDIPVDSRNELDIITRSVDRTAQNIGKLVGELSAHARDLEQNAQRIAESASSSADVAATENEAALAMAASVEQMAVCINHVSDSSREARDQASEMLTLAGGGQREVAGALEHMSRIEESVNKASERIRKLDEDAQRINTVVSIIKEVADQTNLLALNAAIEAARAGEQGRGFAVVADEVRKLAERSANSTLEISAVIDSIQHDANEAAIGMEEAVTLANAGVGAVTGARRVIDDIESGAHHIAAATTDISDALREQSAASNAVGKEVEQIAQLSNRAAASADGSSRVAGELHTLANTMTEAVSRFRT
jgi:methyl-accepting chemotaxis protein